MSLPTLFFECPSPSAPASFVASAPLQIADRVGINKKVKYQARVFAATAATAVVISHTFSTTNAVSSLWISWSSEWKVDKTGMEAGGTITYMLPTIKLTSSYVAHIECVSAGSLGLFGINLIGRSRHTLLFKQLCYLWLSVNINVQFQNESLDAVDLSGSFTSFQYDVRVRSSIWKFYCSLLFVACVE